MRERGSKLNKSLDRYIGIPILFFLGLFRQKRKLPANIKNVGIIITPAIGDTIILQTLLKDLKENNCYITIFSPASCLQISRIIGFNDKIEEISFSNVPKTISTIKKYSFDVFIDVGQWTRLSSFFALSSNSKYLVGFNTPGQYKHYVFDKAVPHSNEVHEVYNLKKLSVFNSLNENLPLITSEKKLSEKYAVLHIKPGGYLSYRKELPLEYWKDVIETLLEKNYKIYFSGSKGDSSSIDEFIKTIQSDQLVNATTNNLEETVQLLNDSSLVISVNTGIMHLASALQCNLIALHGPTNYLRWGPLNKNSVSIRSKYKEAPCLNLGFEYNCKDTTCECMKRIDVSEIKEAIDNLESSKM